ncbi:hypothetical protein CRENBAI_016532 [Crenichthys baileyi]|uniref:Uncharacterized protein n=1 Tax=Crenichthys baileyi TaxID=28760 RepID=A0AAV9S6P9_9TELE
MAKPGTQMWTLLALLFQVHLGQPSTCGGTSCPIHFVVSVPGILESGSKNSFCVSLSQPSSGVLVKVRLRGKDSQKILLKKGTSSGFHKCFQFSVPSVEVEEEQQFEVSVKGNDFYSKEIKRVLIKVFKPKTFIQTDKPIYNQGQTVQFRVVTLDTNLTPTIGYYNIILIKDPYNNKIAQWANQTAEGTILQLSYLLGDGAPEGFYRIVAQIGEQRVFHSFKVQKYGLPKFDLVVTIPKEISIGQDTFQVTVCAKYHYGKPVDGDITVRVCRPLKNQNSCTTALIHKDDFSLTSLCKTKQKQTCNKGCSTFTFKVSSFTRHDPKLLLDVLDVSATVVDKLTCVSHTQWERIKITYLIGRLFFEHVPKTYTQGKDLVGKVKAVDYLGKPVPHLTVYLFAGKKGSPCFMDTVKMDHSGIATFSLDTEKFRGEVYLFASSTKDLEYPGHKITYYDIGWFKVDKSCLGPHTCGFLKVLSFDKPLHCFKEEEITIEYSVEQHNQDFLDIVYLVLSRGHIVLQGNEHLHSSLRKFQGRFSFSLKMNPDFAPSIQIVAYTVLDCERVLAHSARFYTKDCFRNKVISKFSPSPALPGEDVRLCIKAQQNSVCGVSLIDLNVLARANAGDLDANQIYNFLPIKKSYPIPPELQDTPECVEVKPRSHAFAFTNQEKDDANTVFTSGPHNPERKALEGAHLPDPGRIPYTCYDDLLEPVHKLSTETWLFDLVKIGQHGKTCVSYTVPEVITTWNADIFCVSPHGFGLAHPVLLSVFRPFSLDFKLPYSMIRGERFKLKSVIYNYLSTSLRIKVTAAASSDYTLTPLSTDQNVFCLCGSEHKILHWTLTPKSLGNVMVSLNAKAVSSRTTCCNQDVSVPESGHSTVVTRSLKVKAKGHEIIQTHSWLLCPKGHYLSEKLDTRIPHNVIDGSLTAKVSVSGNFVSRSLKNLGDLLHMPYGCGEQNIALMAINTYILHYLQKTNQLCKETKKKGLNLLITGKLTAFVMVTFYKARSFIYIDPKITEEAQKWLECQQLNDGCFKVSGKLYNNKIRGDVPDQVTVSAYVTAAFLEINIPPHNPVVKRSLSCLKRNIYDHSNTYTTALLAYVFTLAGDQETRSKLLHHLDSVAIREGDLQYWCLTPKHKASSLCVEISSYVLLARLTGSVSERDLSCSSKIIRWLVTQQSYYGGFESSQDTAVAIKAMTLYSSMVKNRGSTSVTVTSPNDHLSFQVNEHNKLVYQELMLQNLKGKYWLKAEGTSCTAVQVALLYNVPASAVVCSFSVEVEVVIHNCCHERLVTLKLKSLYKGDRSVTNMVVLDIEIPSGFCPVPESLWNLRKGVLVNYVEYQKGHVFVYLKELHKDIAVFHELELIQEYEVQHLRQSTVAIYDYYCPSVQGLTEYCGKHCYSEKDSHTHKQHHQDYKGHHHVSHDHQSQHHHDYKGHHHISHDHQSQHHHDYKGHHHISHDHQSHHHHVSHRYQWRRHNPFRHFHRFKHGSRKNHRPHSHPKHHHDHYHGHH